MITLQELAPFLTFLSDGREWRWFPFLSFFSGVQTPGSVWVERSDSTDSLVLLFQSDVPLWCSVSLLRGKTKVSSSEPDQKKIIILNNNFRDFLLTEDSVCFADCIWRRKDALQLLPLVLKSGAGVHGQDPVVFLCFFKHSIPTRSLQCLWQFIPQSGRQRKC